jgi:lysophospholipase L1-like esterase
MRTVTESRTARASVAPDPGTALGSLTFTIWYRTAPGVELLVQLGDERRSLTSSPPLASILRAELAAPGPLRLELATSGGKVELFGVAVEGSEPGVVVDTLGIDGARVATPLAWNEASWIELAKAREPALAVLAYGTNEVFDAHVSVEAYAVQYAELVARLRRAEPQIECLIVGPPDVATPEGASHPRAIEITALQRRVAPELGCGFVSALEVMGGQGSFARWAIRTPAWARDDRVHLTSQGYDELGRRMADLLLDDYDKVIGD